MVLLFFIFFFLQTKILREAKIVPNLIYTIEQCERHLIQLTKKSRVNLMKNVKRSTARDFRIQVHELDATLHPDSESKKVSLSLVHLYLRMSLSIFHPTYHRIKKEPHYPKRHLIIPWK
jgi:hypothetical protein